MTRKDQRTPLPAGTALRCGGVRYILGEAVSFGGSSVFYSARKEGSDLPFGVKECYPAEMAGDLKREDGVLTGVDEMADEALSLARARFMKETEISQKVAAVSSRSIPVLENPNGSAVETENGPTLAPEGSFMVLRQVSAAGMFLPELLEECALPGEEGHPLRTGGRPHIRTAARVLEQTLRAVELVHKAGYLYGDVQPGNIFFADARPEKGDVGFGCLLDFGCARPFVDGLKTAPIADRMVFSTQGYTAPEIVWDNDGTLQLTPAADVYSDGRLLLSLLRGRTYYENGRDRVLEEGASLIRLLPAEGERLGCTREVLRQTQRILNRSLCVNPEDRYQSAGEMLADVEKLVRMTQTPEFKLALSFSPLGEGEFLGREEKLSEIDRGLRQRRKPVTIWGFAGMGKTELAIEFGRQYERENRGQVYFVRLQNSVRQTVTGPIANAFSGYDRKNAAGQEKPEEQIYREVMKLLGERDENDLLILDNMDGGAGGYDALRGEPAFRELCALPMGLLVTTRSQVEGGIEVDELPLPRLRKLMRRFVPALSDEMADRLIAAVEGHTLTVELMARTLKISIPHLSPEALLEKMETGDLDSHAFASVSGPKDREWKMARIQGHLTALFRLSELPEEEKKVLGYALPISEQGLDAEDFARIPDFDQDVLLRLIDRGWIRRSVDNILTLHPLVQEVGWREVNTSIPALIRFSECTISLPILYNKNCTSDESFTRGIGYLSGICRHTEHPPEKIYAGLRMAALLDLWGRAGRALEQAEKLLKWLKERPDAEQYPQSMSSLLCFCADLLEPNWPEVADDYRNKADMLAVSDQNITDQDITEEDALYEPEQLPVVLAGQIGCMEMLKEAVEQGDDEKTLQLYQRIRVWFCDQKLNTADLDLMVLDIYQERDDAENYYLTLKNVCAGMDDWARATCDQADVMLSLSECCVVRGDLQEGRMWMHRTLDMVEKIFPDERNKFFRESCKDAIRLARDSGWDDEAAALQEGLDDYWSRMADQMRKENDAHPLNPKDLKPETKELLRTFHVDMAFFAEMAGWTDEAEAWRDAMGEMDEDEAWLDAMGEMDEDEDWLDGMEDMEDEEDL